MTLRSIQLFKKIASWADLMGVVLIFRGAHIILSTLILVSILVLLSIILSRANHISPLEGTAWRLVEWHSSSTTEITLNSDTVTLWFAPQDQVIYGQAACNQYQGTANYYNGGAELAIQVFGMSRKRCEEPLMAQDQLYISALKQARSYQITTQEKLKIEYQLLQENESGILIFQHLN